MREPEGYRPQLEQLVDLWPKRVSVSITEAAAAIGADRRTLLADKTFPKKMVGKKYTVSITELARWLVTA